MPYIDENHLVDLHKTIESKELQEQRLLLELKKQRLEKEGLNRSREVLRTVSVGLFVMLIISVLLNINRSSIDMSDLYLESENKMIIDRGEVEAYLEEISQLKQQLNSGGLENPVESARKVLDTSIIYAVQVAAFESKGISLYSNELKNISQYKDKSFNKYALGNFTNLDDANSFRREMVTLGFKDVFVASYKDGKRIKIEEAF